MPPSPRELSAQPSYAPSPSRLRSVEGLLRDLGPGLQRGSPPQEAELRQPTGIAGLDALLGGGLPQGRLLEIAGPASSGRTSLALGLLASWTQRGETVAWVDPADAFDPQSAEAAGVMLERVLWVRAPGPREALRSSERLLKTPGFSLVVLDFITSERLSGARSASRRSRRAARAELERSSEDWPQASGVQQVGAAACLRLTRAAVASRAVLVLLCEQRCAGTFSDLALELGPARARFTASPALLEATETRAVLVRNRLGPSGRSANFRLHSDTEQAA